MDESEQILEALLTLGWNITVDDMGSIHAEPGDSQQGGSPIEGEIQNDGTIQWQNVGGARWVMKRARILAIRQRISVAPRPRVL
jgi:hypothetical protein